MRFALWLGIDGEAAVRDKILDLQQAAASDMTVILISAV
jgi:hypothetical protein